MKAIVLQGAPGKASYVTDRPYPALRPGYVSVDVKAIALNPADWKHIDYSILNTKGHLVGCDYAGVVSQVGEGYSKTWKVGDRICGFVHGGNQHEAEDGAFAERIVVKADIQMRIPENLSFEEAATLGAGVITCGQGLFQYMGLDLPKKTATSNGKIILIYGGSTATGSVGIQFAKL
jgi:NADPH:quinone reductase-like Zn-dependent oxidoreductase